jgi:hypothetical protein
MTWLLFDVSVKGVECTFAVQMVFWPRLSVTTTLPSWPDKVVLLVVPAPKLAVGGAVIERLPPVRLNCVVVSCEVEDWA